MGLRLKAKEQMDIKKSYKPDSTNCPICDCVINGSIYNHFQEKHGLDSFRDCIIKDFDKGCSHIEIGKKYGVTLKNIEKIITDNKGINISNHKPSCSGNLEPKDFKEETTTVWSFKNRGSWASHSAQYRGNWSPYIPRNIILKYTSEGDLILDNFCGAGTTAIEAKLLNRRCVALDINKHAIEMAKKNLHCISGANKLFSNIMYEPELIVADARSLSLCQDNTFDLVCSHPPYADIIKYTNKENGDLSHLDVNDFLREMKKVADESVRVLKPGKKCAVLIGDMRKNKCVIPLGFKLMDVYLSAGFSLHDIIIKRQHNCKTTGFWYSNSIKHNFLLLAHEYLFIFEKPSYNNSSLSTFNKDVSDLSENFVFDEEILINEEIKLETTTVWIFQESEFQQKMLLNILNRYGKHEGKFDYAILKPSNKSFDKKSIKKLFLIPCVNPLSNNTNELINFVLGNIDLISQHLNFIKKDGYFIIHTRDIELNGCVVSLAKMFIDKINIPTLKLKEIIISVRESNKPILKASKRLKRIHSYILVYERK
ncbi:MAG: DNA methyltransferase [Thermodesulfovibrionales bacterium]|nr:DNA methyltransferase [Thermodesulfovibrionales bacterium]